jgi:hypothetical protein
MTRGAVPRTERGNRAMKRSRRASRIAVIVATVVAACVAVAGGASAAEVPPAGAGLVLDLPLAVAETQVAQADAVAAAVIANASNPDVTCGNPTPVGVAVVPPTNVGSLAIVNGQDLASGQGTCASLQAGTWDATLDLVVEYRQAAGSWFPIDRCLSRTTTPASGGLVAEVVGQPFLCATQPGSEAAGEPHRVHAFLTNSITGVTYEGYSDVFLTPDASVLA